MPWFPLKKIRKQIKLLLLLVLLTCAAWLTYVHLSLVRQGRALRQRLGYGRGTGGGARPGAGSGEDPRAAPVRALPLRPALGVGQTRPHTLSALPSSVILGQGARFGPARTPYDVTSDERDPLGERP